MSNHFLGCGSSSMKRKKNCSGSEKPTRRASRGLGVAQLESIRLQGEMAAKGYQHPSCHYNIPLPTYTNEGFRGATAGYSSLMASSSPFAHSTAAPPYASAASDGFHHATAMMEFAGYKLANRFSYFQLSQDTRWGSRATKMKGQSFTSLPSMTTRHLLNLHQEDSPHKKELTAWSDSIRSSSQNPGSIDNEEEIDLELRL